MPRRTNNAPTSLKTPPGVGISELLAAVVRKHYNPIEDPKGVDGPQMWNCQWWMPLWGCDTLENMLDDMAYAIARQQAANESSSPTAGGGSGGAQPKDSNEK